MKERIPVKTRKIIYSVLIVVAVLVVIGVTISSLYPTFYLKGGDVKIEVGETFDPQSIITKVRNMNEFDIEITSELNNMVPGTYNVTYKHVMKTEVKKVIVEDRDYPVFEIKDNQDYLMSTDFDINNIVVNMTDKTGVTDFHWSAKTGGINIPGRAELELSASDAYGHTTVNSAVVNVIDDVFPELVLKTGDFTVEAGDAFDPAIVVEKATDNYLTPVVSYEVVSGSFTKVGKVTVTIFATDTVGNEVSKDITLKTVDTTAPTVKEKDESHVYKMSEKFDASKYFDIKDNTINTNTTYEIVSGSLKSVGTIQVAVKVSDNYANVTDAGTISIEVQDDIPPEFTLTKDSYSINLGKSFDVKSIIASSSDNSGEVTFSYKVTKGTLEHAGKSTVEVIATDMYGNSAAKQVTVNVVDKVAPELTLVKNNMYYIIGDEFDAEALVASCTDNDGSAKISMELSSGSLKTPGNAVVYIVATDPSGNRTRVAVSVKVKERLYADFGTETHVDITGDERYTYLIAVNRYMGVVTVYGKDDNGDYTVPVRAMLCSVGKASELESNFGVRSGNGLTPLGVYSTLNQARWGTLFGNDGVHEYVYGQYTTRIVGHILFHSVPYFWQRNDTLEWTGTPDELVHEFNKLGSPASMGCIRMCVRDVKWVFDNCEEGFTVVIYDERDNYGPLGRPENFIIDPSSEMLADIDPELLKLSGFDKNAFAKNPTAPTNPLNWDPTDPDPKNPWIPILEAWEKKQQEQGENND